MDLNKIYEGNCLELMKDISDKSIDMILCDLPYGTTACEWDSVIDFNELWKQYERIIKDNGAIVLTSCMPFTIDLINSNRKLFRYNWYWIKEQGTGFANANRMPLKIIEEVCVFYKNLPLYSPEKIKLKKPKNIKRKENTSSKSNVMTSRKYLNKRVKYEFETPTNILIYERERGLHPTQKPIKLFKYLIKTYTKEGDLVLDNCIGSGTTAVACKQTKRNFIGMELDKKYVKIARSRLKQEVLL